MVGSSFRKALILSAILISAGGKATPRATLVRDCQVWNLPTETPGENKRKPIGELKANTAIDRIGKLKKGFVQVEAGKVRGYVLRSCLQLADGARKPDSLLYSSYSGDQFRFGIIGSLDANLAKGSSTADFGTGIGYGVGLNGLIPLSRTFRLSLSSYVRQISATRALSLSGQISDPSTLTYTQSILFAAVSLVGQLNLVRTSGINTPLEWWIDAGAEYLFPVSATQTDSAGEVITFTATDKPLFGLLGASMFYNFDNGIGIMSYLHGFYNVFATGGNSLLGARLGVSVSLSL